MSVRSEQRGAAAWITIDRPQARNALSRAVVAGIREAMAEATARPQVRAIVLSGAGGEAFCAGADLKERRTMTLDDTRQYLIDLRAMIEAVAGAPRPTIAALDGAARGARPQLSLAC